MQASSCRAPGAIPLRLIRRSARLLRRLADSELRGGLSLVPLRRGLGLAPGRPRAARHLGSVRSARGELDDPEAHDLVGDPQRAIQVLEQLRRGVELQQVVLGVGLVIDRVGQRSDAPLVVTQELATGPRSPRARRRRSSCAWAPRPRGRARSRDRMWARAGSWRRRGRVSGSGPYTVRKPPSLSSAATETRAEAVFGTVTDQRVVPLRADVGELLVDPVPGVAGGDDLHQPLGAATALARPTSSARRRSSWRAPGCRTG